MIEHGTQYVSAAMSDRGLSEKRPQNEDSYLELQQYGLFVVADGVGGAQAGDVASQMAVEILGEAFINLPEGADAEERMTTAIDRANSAIFQMSRDLPQLASMATTIVALHLAGEIATIAHVGDSRIYRVDESGQIFRETQDHSVVEEEVRAGRMTAEQALNHPSRNVISRALGAEESVQIDAKTLLVPPSNTFLLCSDGITRHINDTEIAALLSSDGEPAEICRQMKELCYDRGAEDNLTAVIIKFTAEKAAEVYAATKSGTELDPELITIASARSHFDKPVESEGMGDRSQESVIRASDSDDIDMPALRSENTSALHNSESVNEDLSNYTASSPIAEQEAKFEKRDTTFSEQKVPSTEAANSGSLFNKALSVIGLLIIGGLIGAGGHYFWLQSSPASVSPVITETKSNNTALTAFEEGRRRVDDDPAKYLIVDSANPQEAEDYFLLGRAFLLTGKPQEAKQAFGEAKNRLSQVEASNAKTLAAEIAMALAIIDSPQAAQAFADEIPANVPAVNANLAPVANQSIP